MTPSSGKLFFPTSFGPLPTLKEKPIPPKEPHKYALNFIVTPYIFSHSSDRFNLPLITTFGDPVVVTSSYLRRLEESQAGLTDQGFIFVLLGIPSYYLYAHISFSWNTVTSNTIATASQALETDFAF